MSKFDPDAFLGTTEPEQKKKRGFDPDAFLATPAPAPRETAAQSFGRGAASLADSVLNTVTGTLDVPARALARAYYGGVQGMPLAQAEQRAVAETTSPKDVFGRALGITGTAGYEQAPLRQLGTAIGETLGENVIQPVSRATGFPETYVGDVASMLPVPAAPAVARTAGRAATAAVDTGRAIKSAAPEFAKGVMGQASGKGTKPGERATYAGQYESARQPTGTTYHKPEDLQAWREGIISTDELNRRATPYTAEQATALGRTGGMVPYSGQVARATGEAFIEPYTTFKGYMPDVALGALGYGLLGPLGAAALPAANLVRRGVNLYNAGKTAGSMRQLGDLGFTPLYPEQLAAIRKGEPNPSVINPNVAGPVQPMPEVAPTPQVTTQPIVPTFADIRQQKQAAAAQIAQNQMAGIAEPTAPVVPSPLESQVTPDIQQAAAQGMGAPTVKPLTVEPTIDKTPEQLAAEQSILDLINSRRGVVTPEPEPIPQVEPKKRMRQEQRIAEREAQMTPEELAAQEAEVARNLAKSTGKKQSTDLKQQYKSPAEMRKALYGKMPNDELDALVSKTFPSAETLLQKMTQTKTPEDAAVAEALRQRLEALAAQNKYRAPKNTNQMMTGPVEPVAPSTLPQTTTKSIDQMIQENASLHQQIDRQLGSRTSQSDAMIPTNKNGIMSYGTEQYPLPLDDAKYAIFKESVTNTPHSVWTEKNGIKYNIADRGLSGKFVTAVNKDGTAVEWYGNSTTGYNRKEYDAAGNMKGFPKSSNTPFPDFPDFTGDILTSDPAPSGSLIKERMSRKQPPNDVLQALTRVKDRLVDLDAPVSKRNKTDITSATTVDTPVFKQVYASVDDFTFDNAFNEIRGEPLQGKFLSADKKKVIEVEPNPDFDPTNDASVKQAPLRAYDANTGERVPVKDTWTEKDPAEYIQLLKAQKSDKPYKMVYEDESMGIYDAQGNFAKTKRFKFEPDVKLTDISIAKTLYNDDAPYKIYQGINRKNGNVVEILIDSPDSLSRNGAAYEYNEYASGKLPKSLFPSASKRQDKGKQVVGELRFVDIDDAGEIIKTSRDYMKEIK